LAPDVTLRPMQPKISIQPDWRTDDFDFDLPPELIAQKPAEPRDSARLLHLPRQGMAGDKHVHDLPELLQPGDLLIFNDTRVIPARLFGARGDVGVEVLLHRKTAPQTWLALAKPGKRLHKNDVIDFAPGFSAIVLEKREDGEILIRFAAEDENIPALLETHGETPLPPYIRRDEGASAEDRAAYQTIYATREGAIAAPTAGLHFTPDLVTRLATQGIECATVTLHVGLGTFLPVKAERLGDHVMHAEWGEISPGIAAYITKARRERRRIVAVGTTSLRLIESAADENGVVHPFKGDTDLFIYPGYSFRAVDKLLTNFHLPKSTLFMLVCAFAGMQRMQEVYEHARMLRYRFYSYGDACLLEKA
jgi:S-adenosylmethionine:tRNA ribosyltransferase-isomerase